MPASIVPFHPSHLAPAAALVCQRYRRLRQDVPHLPESYAQENAFLPRLESLLNKSPSDSGFACIRNGELAGFLLGLEIPDFIGQRAVYSPEWANAALLDESWPIYEALYTRWSGYWAERGNRVHLVSLLASDRDAVDAWEWLGFGMLVVDGVRDFSPLPQDLVRDYRIHRLLPDAQGAFSAQDLALVAQFDQALLEHLLAAPCFWPHAVEEASSFSGADWLAVPGNALWFAYQGEEPLGYLGITPNSQDSCTIIRDPGTASIVKAYTLPAARGTGVGFTLLNHSLAWAKDQGYQRCSVDYEAANPPARRFWERCFQPVVFSLMRVVLRQG